MRNVLLFPCHKEENWDMESSSELQKITVLGKAMPGFISQAIRQQNRGFELPRYLPPQLGRPPSPQPHTVLVAF